MISELNSSVKNGNFLISLLVKQYFQGEIKSVVFCSLAAESFYLKNEANELLIKISLNDVSRCACY